MRTCNEAPSFEAASIDATQACEPRAKWHPLQSGRAHGAAKRNGVAYIISLADGQGTYSVHETYTFNFLETISAQLQARLELLPVTALSDSALLQLAKFQIESSYKQGVYLLHYAGSPVYLGKANDVCDRLGQHRQKLLGRRGIDPSAIGYKALLLDPSMSTAANEDLLIAMFKESHSGMWNGKGFGPKDPGQHRDTTQPNWFDRTYPIIHDFPIPGLSDREELGHVLEAMKATLPYTFRFDVPASEKSRQLQLVGTARDAQSLLQHVVNSLGPGWRGVIISYGMLLYKSEKDYPHGTVLLPAA